jgi:hypothetical protein
MGAKWLEHLIYDHGLDHHSHHYNIKYMYKKGNAYSFVIYESENSIPLGPSAEQG